MSSTNDGKGGGYLKGDSHDNGGISAVVTDDGNRPVELEGDEVILNKASMADEEVVTVTGTPKEIASAINSKDGNGVKFAEGAEMRDEDGSILSYADGGEITADAFREYLTFLRWFEPNFEG